jgi:isovaleryl-CoA dehydrogenase
MWITNGTLTGKETGDLFLVYARTGEKRSDITQFIVEGGMDGFSVGQKIQDKLGMRGEPFVVRNSCMVKTALSRVICYFTTY